ncbi:MAG: putative viral replication protein [Circoviridae sp.]|nr:MAG: putative viral replication protein [Circoviridae sp.]
MSRLRSVCFTVNNPVVTKQSLLDTLKEQSIKKCIIGSEVGEYGTRHLQGYVMFRNPRSFAAIKVLIPKAHIEKANGTEAANFEYCSKDGDFVSFGEFRNLRQSGSKRNRDILRSILRHKTKDYISSGAYINRAHVFSDIARTIRFDRFDIYMYGQLRTLVLRKFQLQLLTQLFTQDDRKICWVYDTFGGKGKSMLAKYLHYVYRYELFDGVTSARDCAPLMRDVPSGIVFDVTRTDSAHFSYQTLEQVKNGYVMSGKYQGYIKKFKIVPVIVFSNFMPIRDSLSDDRWDIHNINDADVKEDIQGTEKFKEAYPPPPCKEDPLPDEDEENKENIDPQSNSQVRIPSWN